MNFDKITNEYYSQWLGISHEIINTNSVILTVSPERDKIQIGYSHAFHIYTYITQNQIIISCSKKTLEKVNEIKDQIQPEMTADQVAVIMEVALNVPIGRSIKFCYNQIPSDIDTTNVVQLTDDHYHKYLEFFMTQHRNGSPEGWLEEYFYDISRNGYVFGVFENDKLVSVTDAPDMPYMQDKVQEIGINTLSEYRCKGYAKSVTLSCIKAIIEKGKCPLWSCSTHNTASERLAYSVGFRKLADVLTLGI